MKTVIDLQKLQTDGFAVGDVIYDSFLGVPSGLVALGLASALARCIAVISQTEADCAEGTERFASDLKKQAMHLFLTKPSSKKMVSH